MANNTFKSSYLDANVTISFLKKRNPKHTMAGTQKWVEEFIFGAAIVYEGSREAAIQKWNGRSLRLPENRPNTMISEILIEIETK